MFSSIYFTSKLLLVLKTLRWLLLKQHGEYYYSQVAINIVRLENVNINKAIVINTCQIYISPYYNTVRLYTISGGTVKLLDCDHLNGEPDISTIKSFIQSKEPCIRGKPNNWWICAHIFQKASWNQDIFFFILFFLHKLFSWQ